MLISISLTYGTNQENVQKERQKNAITAYNAKKPYKQKQLFRSFERAQMENTNTRLATLLTERTNEKGTLILNAGKPNILEKDGHPTFPWD